MAVFYKKEREQRQQTMCFQFFETYTGDRHPVWAAFRELKLSFDRISELFAQWSTMKETMKETAAREAAESAKREAAIKAREGYERGKRALEKDREAMLARLAAEKLRLGIS